MSSFQPDPCALCHLRHAEGWCLGDAEPQEGAPLAAEATPDSSEVVATRKDASAGGVPSCGSDDRAVQRAANLTEDVAHVVSLYGAEDVRRALEFQEGAPRSNLESAGATDGDASGVPSCDSELAAIQERATCQQLLTPEDFGQCAADRETLLRMVEELTEALEEAEKRCWHPSTVALNDIALRLNGVGAEIHSAMVKERDDLRKQVEELQSRPLFWSFKQVCGERDELHAKLAQAERYRDKWKRAAKAIRRSECVFYGGYSRLEAELSIAEKTIRDLNNEGLTWKHQAGAAAKECDDLRAKLVETEQRGVDYIRAIGKDCFAAITELEAKLAEAENRSRVLEQAQEAYLQGIETVTKRAEAAEKMVQHKVEELRAESAKFWEERRRAEAAEARCRVLTNALFAASGGHVDLDKLDEGDGL